MVTKEQAVNLKHGDVLHKNGFCEVKIGPKGGRKEFVLRVRVASQVKTWVRSPELFRFTVKHGMRPETYEINIENGKDFHLASECPEGIM